MVVIFLVQAWTYHEIDKEIPPRVLLFEEDLWGL